MKVDYVLSGISRIHQVRIFSGATRGACRQWWIEYWIQKLKKRFKRRCKLKVSDFLFQNFNRFL